MLRLHSAPRPHRATGRGTVCVRMRDDTTPPFRMNIPIMRYLPGSVAAAFALAFLAGSWSILSAQQKPPRPGSSPAPAANAQPAVGLPRTVPQAKAPPVTQTSGQRTIPDAPDKNAPPEVVSKELEDILRRWELESSKIKSLHGTHQRTVYNLVFHEQKIADGKFFVEMPDRGRIDLVGINPKTVKPAKRTGKDGKEFQFTVLADRAEKWICTGKEVVVVNDEAKTFEVMPLPKEAQGKNIVNTPLPFLFGMKAEDAKQRFRMEVRENTENRVVLVVRPRLDSDRQNYTEAWIILDKTNYLPMAVKMFDPSGNMETVYTFASVKVNDNGILSNLGKMFGGDSNPWQPNLKNYKIVLPPIAETEVPKKNAQTDPRLNPPNPRPTNASGAKDATRTNPNGANPGGTKIK